MKIFVLCVLMLFFRLSDAAEIAVCTNPSGHAYYPEMGVVNKNSSGWQKENITDGKITLTADETGKIDLLFVDATKKINSSAEQGAKVTLISQSKQDFRVMVFYPNSGAIEIYSFWYNNRGEKEYSVITSRTSDALIMKSSLMKGKCSFLNSVLFRSTE